MDRLVEINHRLNDPRGLSEADALALAQEGVPFYFLYATIHSNEVGNGQTIIEIAHRLATEESAEIQEILDNTVLLMVPSQNPDGQVLAVAGDEDETVWLWDRATNATGTVALKGELNGLAWKPGARLLATASSVLVVWDAGTREAVEEQQDGGEKSKVPDPPNDEGHSPGTRCMGLFEFERGEEL
jgi:hypothetical protein